MAGPLNQIANPYQAYNDLINQQIGQMQGQPQYSMFNDPAAMFALAQGFLSPTRTGSFGESMGNAAGMAVGPLSKARQADQDRMDKIAKLRETQVKLALEKQRIDDLNSRAASGVSSDPILDYSRAMAGLEREASMVGDPGALDLDTNTPEGKAEKERRLQERAAIREQMKSLRSRYFNGAGAGARPSSDAGSSRPVDTEEETPSRRQAPANAEPGFQNSAMPQAGGRRAAPSGAAAAAPAGRAGRIASDTDLENARNAYKQGAAIQAILKRFKDNGITGITAEDITSGK